MAGGDTAHTSLDKQERLLSQTEREESLLAMNTASTTRADSVSKDRKPHSKVGLKNFGSIVDQEGAVPPVASSEDLPSESESRGCKILYILMFAFIGLNDGMVIGYKSSLTGIFTEQGVPSEQRSLLSLITLVYAMRMFFAPLADKYFSKLIGKRRTYLLPCKVFSAFAYMLCSAYIEQWVREGRVLVITIYFLLVNTVMILENNALQGYRIDFFWRQNSGSAGASQTIGLYVGLAIGLQLFTCLNSDYITRTYLNLGGAVLSHKGFFRIIAGKIGRAHV